MNEDIKTSFIIKRPSTVRESDFNTLILRLSDLRNSIEDTDNCKDDFFIEIHNQNIQKIQEILENYKIKKWG